MKSPNVCEINRKGNKQKIGILNHDNESFINYIVHKVFEWISFFHKHSCFEIVNITKSSLTNSTNIYRCTKDLEKWRNRDTVVNYIMKLYCHLCWSLFPSLYFRKLGRSYRRYLRAPKKLKNFIIPKPKYIRGTNTKREIRGKVLVPNIPCRWKREIEDQLGIPKPCILWRTSSSWLPREVAFLFSSVYFHTWDLFSIFSFI